MGWLDWLIIAGIALVVGGAVVYIIHAKRSGKKCIGCPDGSSCSGHCSSCPSCPSHKNGSEKQ